LASGGNDATVRLWDLSGPEPRERAVIQTGPGRVFALAFAPDGKKLACGGYWEDRMVSLYELKEPKHKETFLPGHHNTVTCLSFTPDGKRLVSVGRDGLVNLWNVDFEKQVWTTQLPGPSYCAGFAPDGRHLALGNSNGTVYVLRMAPPPGKVGK
jgi:WD40 repeat protein